MKRFTYLYFPRTQEGIVGIGLSTNIETADALRLIAQYPEPGQDVTPMPRQPRRVLLMVHTVLSTCLSELAGVTP